jgi:RNA polymerase sigma-70 factor (ECF subfamily)
METLHATHNKNSDGALIAATKRGDARASDELVSRYGRRVFAAALRITKNREDSEDVVQESFHKAFLHLNEFQEKSRFSTWLTRIAMNEALRLLRRRREVVEISAESPDDCAKPLMRAFVDRCPSPEESSWRQERKQLLTEAINGLGSTIRGTVLLRIVEDRSVQETARILGISTAAVKSRLFHGRRKLRRSVNPGLRRSIFAASRGRQSTVEF